jgi:hypothetical protein
VNGVLGEPFGDEVGEFPPVLGEDAHGAVAGVDQSHRGGDDPAQDRAQVEFAADGQHGGQQGLQLLLGTAQ